MFRGAAMTNPTGVNRTVSALSHVSLAPKYFHDLGHFTHLREIHRTNRRRSSVSGYAHYRSVLSLCLKSRISVNWMLIVERSQMRFG